MGKLIIKCYLIDIYEDNIILSLAEMDCVFINEESKEYDIILPFEFTFKKEINQLNKGIQEDKNLDINNTIIELKEAEYNNGIKKMDFHFIN